MVNNHAIMATKLVAVWGLVLALLLAGVSPVAAQSFSASPQDHSKSYYEFTLEAGATLEDGLVLSNSLDTTSQLNITVVRATTMRAGGIGYSGESTGPAQWIQFAQPGPVTLVPQATSLVPFRVTVPAGTEPGEYVAGIIVTPTQPDSAQAVDVNVPAPETDATSGEESSFKVNVVTRRAIAVVITVPGPSRCAATVEAITSGVERDHWQLDLDIRNTGNVHFRSAGMLTVRNAGDAQPIYETPFQLGYFIPGDTIAFAHRPDVNPPAGDYEVEASLDTDCGFATSFIQPISLSQEEVTTVAAAAQADNVGQPQSVAVDAEAARMQAQAEWIRSMAWLLGGIAVLVLAIGLIVLAVVWVLRRRPPPVQVTQPPRQGGPSYGSR